MLRRKKLMKLKLKRQKSQVVVLPSLASPPIRKRQSSTAWQKDYFKDFVGFHMATAPIESVAGGGTRHSIFDLEWKAEAIHGDNQAMLEREKKAMEDAREKATRVGMLCPKSSASQYMGNPTKEEFKTFGKKIVPI